MGGASGDVTDVRQSQTGIDVMNGCVEVEAGVIIVTVRLLCTLVSSSRVTMACLADVVGFVEVVAVICGGDRRAGR
eukprot:4682529-Amphidinium_carterae.1